MKKLKIAFVLLFVGIQVFAQTNIKGVILDSQASPIPGASIVVKGLSGSGTLSSSDGTYSINVPDEAEILIFSFVGMQSQEVAINGQTTIDVLLENGDIALDDVIVTALGIKREKKALGYAVQQVSGSEITESGRVDLISAMQGKVAGVNITTAGGAGASTRIVIRGANSLDPDAENQPLFVIDGIPMNNSTNSGDIKPSTGSNADNSAEQFGFSNRAMDINPNDIESMSILKGAAATALYGARAANGAVIITTKKGKKGETTINFNSSLTFDKVVELPEMQTRWGRGRISVADLNAVIDMGNEPDLNLISGNAPNFYNYGYLLEDVGQTFYNNMENFFNTGVTYDNSISISGGSEKGTFYLSASNLYQEGIVPSTDWGRTTVKLSASRNVSSKLKTSASVSYINSGGNRGNHGDKSYMSSLLNWSNSVDMENYKDEYGAMITTAYIDNPYYVLEQTSMVDNVNRVIGNANISYNILDNLTLSYRLGTDVYSDSRTYIVPYTQSANETPLDIATGVGGFIVEERINFRETNSDLMLSYQADISEDLKFSAILGNNVLMSVYDRLNSRGETWATPNFYDISNTTYKFTTNTDIVKRMIGFYGNLRLEYKDYLFLGITGRNDISSTLPIESRSYFYPSANLGFVFTEALGIESNILSYGKIRGSWAKVAKDAPAHRLDKLYSAYTFLETPLLTKDNSLGNSNLKPEMTTSIELGADLRFLNNRLALDFSWYKANTVDMLFPIPVANSTGYTAILDNLGELENKGFEFLLSAKIMDADELKWNIAVNFSTNKTKVLELNDDLEEIEMSRGDGGVHQKLVVGGYYGDVYGYTYKTYTDDNGTESLIVNSDGTPSVDWSESILMGNVNPDWTLGITNSFSHRGFNLSFLIDIKQGQMVLNEHFRTLMRVGKIDYTANRPTAEQGGITLEGVNVDENGVATPNETPISSYYSFYRNDEVSNAETILQDASWIRLRTLSLTYNLPKRLMEKIKGIKALSVTLTANNLWISTDYYGFDPEISKYGAGSNAQGYSGFSTPNTRRLGASLNLTF